MDIGRRKAKWPGVAKSNCFSFARLDEIDRSRFSEFPHASRFFLDGKGPFDFFHWRVYPVVYEHKLLRGKEKVDLAIGLLVRTLRRRWPKEAIRKSWELARRRLVVSFAYRYGVVLYV